MKERPMLMSAPMVRAILDGRKTQTRRTVKPQPTGFLGGPGVTMGDGTPAPRVPVDDCAGEFGRVIQCPYGQPGDRLWVREAWRASSAHDNLAPREIPIGDGVEYGSDPEKTLTGKPRPSIHMPRWASRILLEIVSVRVERLNDISEADAIAEGIERAGGEMSCSPWRNYRLGQPGEMRMHCSAPSRSYMTLWDSINGPGSWDANPLVWVIEFKRVEVPT